MAETTEELAGRVSSEEADFVVVGEDAVIDIEPLVLAIANAAVRIL